MGLFDFRDRVRANTPETLNKKIDRQINENISLYSNANPELISRRIEELDKEWDIERAIEVNASALGLTGLLLGVTVHKRWLILPGVVLTFLLQHGIQGWCPPVPLFRSMGVRTRKEIDKEKYALKKLRGDDSIVNPVI